MAGSPELLAGSGVIAARRIGRDERAFVLQRDVKRCDPPQANTAGGDQAIEVRNNVAALLEYMPTTEDTGSDFGLGVASRAEVVSGANLGDDAANNAGSDVADEGVDNADSDAADNADNAEEAEDAGPPESVPPVDIPNRP